MTPRRRKLLVVVGVFVVPIVVVWVVVGAVFSSYYIPSESMAPSLEIGDRVLVRGAHGDEVGRGDVIIYRAVDSRFATPGEQVARVVAVGGDELDADGGFLTVDGERLDEPYLPDGLTTPGLDPLTVPDDHVFVLGDNRPNSQDSRAFGPVPNEDVTGLVSVRWWPPSRFGGV